MPKRNSGSVLMIQAYIRLKLLVGIRHGDMLRLRMSDLTEAGNHGAPAQDHKYQKDCSHL
jgi:integrase